MHKTTTLDITPEGLKSPEGQERVAKALRDKEELASAIVREAARLYRNYLKFLPDEDVADQLSEETPELGILLDEYDKAHETFMLAITGR